MCGVWRLKCLKLFQNIQRSWAMIGSKRRGENAWKFQTELNWLGETNRRQVNEVWKSRRVRRDTFEPAKKILKENFLKCEILHFNGVGWNLFSSSCFLSFPRGLYPRQWYDNSIFFSHIFMINISRHSINSRPTASCWIFHFYFLKHPMFIWTLGWNNIWSHLMI